MARAIAVIAAIALAGCGPTLVWHGRSPDRLRRAIVLEEDGHQRVVIDGVAQSPWDAIAIEQLAWTPRGLVYPARQGGAWHLVDGDTVGPAFRAIGEVVANDRLAYAAQDDAGWHVVIDGQVGPAFTWLRAGTLALGSTGRVVYVADDDTGEHAVIDGVVGPAFERVAGLAFGAKGALVAYAAEDERGAHVVIEDRVGPPLDGVIELALASREPRWAAIVRVGQKVLVLRDGERVSEHDDASGLAISGEGAHLAWIVPVEGRVEVWLDGARIAEHDAVERVGFVPGSDALLYVARDGDAVRVVHDGVAGPRVAAVDAIEVSESGHFGYVARRGVGRVVVIDGEVRFRGEWAGALALPANGDQWAFLARQRGQRFVVRPTGRVPIGRPFADTLVLDASGAHWALAIGERAARRIAIVRDGAEVAALDVDEVSAAITQGRDPLRVVRAIVTGELSRGGGE